MAATDLAERSATARAGATTRGIHHLALTTEDMKATCAFYVDILGMPLVHAMTVPPGVGIGPGNRGNPPFEEIRHYFFDMGNDSLLAFFEIPAGEKPPTDRDAIGGMQHVAFAVTRARFEEIQSRLLKHRVDFDGPIDILPGLQSIYFYDLNVIRLEACCQPAAGDSPGVIASVRQSKAAALAELRTMGADEAWLEAMTASLSDDGAG